MSGPKVVRIVTREEILDICLGHLARVDAALAEWTRVGRRNDCVDDEALAIAKQRRTALAALIAEDRFMDLQKQAPIEESFLRDDLQRRLSAVAAEQAEARSRERRGRQAGESLLRRLRALDGPRDPQVEEAIARGDGHALAAGFERLVDAGARSSLDASLAAQLQDQNSVATFAEWLAVQPPAAPDPALERIEARLDELSVLSGPAKYDGLRRRLAEADNAEPARQNLLLDGLEVETGRALTRVRRCTALATDLRLALAELDTVKAERIEARSEAETMDEAELEHAIKVARATLDDVRAARAAATRRAAVLQGLAGLGYEVTEGMSTSWAHDGRLVLRSATRPDYGVEVSAVAGAERMQMRPVAFEAGGPGPDPARDRDAETIWCGDVSTLQAALAEAGGGLAIERATPIGATPLKRIAAGTPGGLAAAEAPSLRERSLR